jgi:hypothetical protein
LRIESWRGVGNTVSNTLDADVSDRSFHLKDYASERFNVFKDSTHPSSNIVVCVLMAMAQGD